MATHTGIRYTGHPLVDGGVATLVAATGVGSPAELTYDAVWTFVQDELVPVYINPFMSNYLGTVVFANINFANPAMNTKSKFDQLRQDRLSAWLSLGLEADPTNRKELLNAIATYQDDNLLPGDVEPPDPGERCAFSGDLAAVRVSRVIVPMTGSETALNFVPEGRPRLPLAGWVLVSLLALPMGTLNSGGQVLLPHTADTDLLQKLAAYNLAQNRRAVQMEGLKKRPNYRFARTELMWQLTQLDHKWAGSYPITVYRFSSAAQSAKIDILSLDTRVVVFIARAQRETPAAWQTVVKRAWRMESPPDETPELTKKGEQIYERRNYFYEDLFLLPQRSHTFLRRYLLRRRRPGSPRGKQKQDPRFTYSTSQEHREVISWKLTELFMEVMMDISKERVAAIRDLGDRLAEYIQRYDARLYQRMYVLRKPHALRRVLGQANANAKRQGLGSLLPYDEFVTVFFYEDRNDASILREDWFLAQDLLMIRIIEQLTLDWVSENADLIEEAEDAALSSEVDDTL